MSKLLFAFMILCTVLFELSARADVGYCTGRCFDNGNGTFFVGAGFDYAPIFRFSQPRVAEYRGIGAAGEIGFDIPSTASFGYRLIIEGGYLNLLNSANNETVSEVGTKQSLGGRFALMFGGLSIGLGGRYSSIEVRQISQNIAPIKQSYNAISGVFVVGYSMKATERIGFTLNSQYERSLSGSTKFQGASLQLLLHFSLLVR